jgi:hypothetical protein
MEREQMVDLVQFIAQLCPAQKINRGTAVAWYDVIGDLDFEAARNAVIALKHSQSWIEPASVIAEVRLAAGRGARPDARTPGEAIAESSLRALPAAQAVPPTAEYRAAKQAWDARVREREQALRAGDWQAGRRANDWLRYKLEGKLPPDTLQDVPALSRWAILQDDPVELRAWLARQHAKERAAERSGHPG